MHRVRAAGFVGMVLGALLGLGSAPPTVRAADDPLARIDPRYLELVTDTLQAVVGGSNREEWRERMAGARAELERGTRDEPDDRVYASLVFAQPLDRGAVLDLERVLGGPLTLLVARAKPSDRTYTLAYDLTRLEGDTAAKFDAIERDQRLGWRPQDHLYGMSVRGPSSLPDDVFAVDERLLQEQHDVVKSPLQLFEVRLISTPPELLRELRSDPRILAVHVWNKVRPPPAEPKGAGR